MRSQKEIKEKQLEMLSNLKLLMDKVRNPQNHDDVDINNLQEHIDAENEQHTLNALIKWVLNE